MTGIIYHPGQSILKSKTAIYYIYLQRYWFDLERERERCDVVPLQTHSDYTAAIEQKFTTYKKLRDVQQRAKGTSFCK